MKGEKAKVCVFAFRAFVILLLQLASDLLAAEIFGMEFRSFFRPGLKSRCLLFSSEMQAA